jgi:hypothetical protein
MRRFAFPQIGAKHLYGHAAQSLAGPVLAGDKNIGKCLKEKE